MREVAVDGERLSDSESVHDDEAQAIDGAVILVLVLGEIVEGLQLLVLRRPVDSSQDLAIEPGADPDRSSMAIELSSEGDGLEDDVIRGEPEMGKPFPVEGFEDLPDPFMVGIAGRGEREEEARCRRRPSGKILIVVLGDGNALGHVLDEPDEAPRVIDVFVFGHIGRKSSSTSVLSLSSTFSMGLKTPSS